MDFNEQTTQPVVVEKKSTLPLIALLGAVLLLGVLVFAYLSTVNTSNELIESEEFMIEINEYGQLMDAEEFSQALIAANELLANSVTELERGRANLSVALAEQQIDPLVALEHFKSISVTETFHPFVRATAMWYVVEGYLANRDIDFARQNIYTGDMWGQFVDSAYIDNPELMYRMASISALRTSLELSTSAQVAMRLATESASLLQYDVFTDEYKQQTATLVLEYIALADQELVEIRNQNVPAYAGSEFVIEVSALNSKALALDALYVDGYITDREEVVDAYRAAVDAIIAYDLPTVHPFFVRYNYADFLVRTDLENSSTTITRILLPMAELTSDNGFARYVSNRLTDGAYNKSERYTGHPVTMRQLTNISPEFKTALLQIGLTEADFLITSPTSASSTASTTTESSA